MSWSIQDVARSSGVTARTLRYYDEIGLLNPARIGENGYRYYEQEQLLVLQQILLLRELGLDLATIGEVVRAEHDPRRALEHHHRELLEERRRIDNLTNTVAATMRHLEEGTAMSPQELFGTMTPERAKLLSGLPKKRVAAGVLFSDVDDRVLLVKPTYRPHWLLPGSVTSTDESPMSSARRAVRRELGLSIEPGRLLVIDWVGPRAGSIEGLLFVFEGPALSAIQQRAIELPADELSDLGWFAPDQLGERLPDHMLRRIMLAREVRGGGSTLYLENGALPDPAE
jgi:DNA-binding transcriptional MerR regulator/ADP-ribose pyrophosphatase YjhB (NUDIX family)